MVQARPHRAPTVPWRSWWVRGSPSTPLKVRGNHPASLSRSLAFLSAFEHSSRDSPTLTQPASPAASQITGTLTRRPSALDCPLGAWRRPRPWRGPPPGIAPPRPPRASMSTHLPTPRLRERARPPDDGRRPGTHGRHRPPRSPRRALRPPRSVHRGGTPKQRNPGRWEGDTSTGWHSIVHEKGGVSSGSVPR